MRIIAHRGASGYLPEHTLPAKALAFAMGADFLEQDVVASRDGKLLVLHDIHLDRVTDVAARYPGRARDDGRFYAIDFDLEELLALKVGERVDAAGLPVYPGRFPTHHGRFGLHTFDDELSFVTGLIASTGMQVGIYPEIKRPAFHRANGTDLSALVLETLHRHGFERHEQQVFVQCFDAAETRRLRSELNCRLKLVQLIGDNAWEESDTDYAWLRSAEGIREMSGIVDGFGPWLNHLYSLDAEGRPRSTGLAERIHSRGAVVHPFTVRSDDLPEGFESLETLIDFLHDDLEVDAVFTDFPDRVLARLTAKKAG